MKLYILIILIGFTYSTQILCSDSTDLKCYTIDRSIELWRLKDTSSTSVVERSADISTIKSYPNPTKDEIVFFVNFLIGSDCIFTIEDINGKRIKSFSNNVVQSVPEFIWDLKNDDGSKVAAGTYFLQILSSSNIYTHKFIIEK